MDKDNRISMKGAPCVRGLKAFKTCPGKSWDGKEGCPLWFEDLITITEGQSKKEVMRCQCADVWAYDFNWWQNARLAGTQEAVETFRNNMTVPGNPKPDPFLVRLVAALETQQRIHTLASNKAQELTGG